MVRDGAEHGCEYESIWRVRTVLVHGEIDIKYPLNVACGAEDGNIDDQGRESKLFDVFWIVVFDGLGVLEVVTIQGVRVGELFGVLRPVRDLGETLEHGHECGYVWGETAAPHLGVRDSDEGPGKVRRTHVDEESIRKLELFVGHAEGEHGVPCGDVLCIPRHGAEALDSAVNVSVRSELLELEREVIWSEKFLWL